MKKGIGADSTSPRRAFYSSPLFGSRIGYVATFGATSTAILLLAGSVWLARYNFDQGGKNDSAGEHAHSQQMLAEKLLSHLKDAETGQRGYLLTGSETYLKPYEAASGKIASDFAQLRAEPQMGGEQGQRLDVIQLLATAKMAELGQTIGLARAGQRRAAIKRVRSGQGRQIMDAIRVRIDELGVRPQADLIRSRASQRPALPRVAVVVLGLLASLLLAGVALGQRRGRRTASANLDRFTRAFGLSQGLLRSAGGAITFWDKGMERLYGFTAREAIGRSADELLNTQYPVSQAQMKASLDSEGHWEGEVVKQHRDGSSLEIATQLAQHNGDQQEILTVIELDNNMTEVRTAQRERNHADALLHNIVESAAGRIYAKDREGRMMLANIATLQFMGRPWPEVEGRTDLELLGDSAQTRTMMANDRRIMETGQVESLEESITNHANELHVWLSTKTPLLNAEGAVTGLVGMSIDVTEHKRSIVRLADLNAQLSDALAERIVAQEALARSESEFRSSFEAAAVGKAQSDPDTGRFIRTNNAFAHMLGYEPQDLGALTDEDLTWPDDRVADMAECARMLAGETGAYIREKRYQTRDGQPVWTRVSSTTLRSPSTNKPTLSISVIENIDQKYKDLLALTAAKAELETVVEERTSALRQRDMLLRETYHRVKNNLQIIDGLLVMQARQLTDPEAATALLNLRGRIHALGLVHHQLMHSKNLVTFDIAPFLAELSANLLEGGADGDIKLSVSAIPLEVGLDFAIPLGLLVAELVTNSLKHAFVDGKGAIQVSLERAADGEVALVVSDNGRGRPAVDAAMGGRKRGLGTSIVKGLVNQLQGTIIMGNDRGARTEIRVAPPVLS